jgi:hypothetical protein
VKNFHRFLEDILYSEKPVSLKVPFPKATPLWWKWQLDVFFLWSEILKEILEPLLFHPRFFMIIGFGGFATLFIYYVVYYISKLKVD